MDFGRKFNQYLTLYRPTGFLETGEPILSGPELVKCRWASTEELIKTNKGDEVYSKAVISSMISFDEGDIVVYGDYSDRITPEGLKYHEVKRVAEMVTIQGNIPGWLYYV